MKDSILWKKTIESLEKSISKAHLLTYFQDATIEEVKKDQVIIAVGNPFTLETIKTRYSEEILLIIQKEIQEIQSIEFIIRDIKKAEKDTTKNIIHTQKPQTVEVVEGITTKLLNEKYSLDSFIVGECNELAYAVGKAVIQEPGKKYNPVFIYGGVGLGKTHLLQSIGNEILKKNQKAKVVYTTTEGFMNDLIESIGKKLTERFRRKYRNIDVLIIDDIQFLENKEKTQEEFFYTFNTLYDHNKQIIISADKTPQEIKGITDRLVSRFQSGMIVEMSTPNAETKLAILQKKTQEQGYLIESEILKHIANNSIGSVRDVEGILKQVIARMDLTNKNPSIEMVNEILKTHKAPITKKKKEDYNDVINNIAKDFNISVIDLLGDSRKKDLSFPRQIAMYVIRKKFKKPFEDIGVIFSNRNHSTVMHAVKKIEELVVNNKESKKQIEKFL